MASVTSGANWARDTLPRPEARPRRPGTLANRSPRDKWRHGRQDSPPRLPRPEPHRIERSSAGTRSRRSDRIEEFLRAGLVAHVAYVEGGEPRTIPFFYLYEAVTSTSTVPRQRHAARPRGRPPGRRLGGPARRSGRLQDRAQPFGQLPQRGRFRTLPPGLRPDSQAPHPRGHDRALLPGAASRTGLRAGQRRRPDSHGTPRDRDRGGPGETRSGGPMGPTDDDADAPGSAFVRPV